MGQRRVLVLMATAAAVLTAGLVGAAVVGSDDDEAPQGVAALPSCRSGPAAEREPSLEGLPGWTQAVLVAAAPDGAECRELSIAEGGDGVVAVHLRLAGPDWAFGIDLERLAGTADDFRSFLPFQLRDAGGGLFRAEGQAGSAYAFPEADGSTWAVSVSRERGAHDPVSVLRRLLAAWP